MKQIINCETGETIFRDLNQDELNQEIIDSENSDKQTIKIENLFNKRLTILDRLGITEEEAKLLLS